MSGTPVAQIIKTIDEQFFVFNNKPREFTVEVQKDDEFISEIELQFTRSPWSQRLPLTLELDPASKSIPPDTFALEVFQYGRDFLERKMEYTGLSEAFYDWEGELYNEEHKNEKPPEKSVYEDIAGNFKLRIEPPPNSAEVLMTAKSVAGALDPIDELMEGPEPLLGVGRLGLIS
ncbi:MAG: hypothetical protein Q9226_006982 [Calogaya cf. arnoldii]